MNEKPSTNVAGDTKQPAPQPHSGENALIYSPAGSLIVTEEPKDSDGESILKMAEFKVYVDLYKFFLKLCLSVNVFYLAVMGGLLTFLFRPVENQLPVENQPLKRLIDTLEEPIKLIFLVTPFILSWVIMLSFAMGAWYWWFSTIAINKELKSTKEIRPKNEVKLITRPFFHLLTWLLAAVTIIFMFVTSMLGWIMAKYGILFCDICFLRWARLQWVAIAASIVVIFLILIKLGKWLMKKLQNEVKPPTKGVGKDAEKNKTGTED